MEDQVKNIITEHLGVVIVSDDQNLADDLGADSLDSVELVMAFEEEFGIEIPDDIVESFSTLTVGAVIAKIKELTA